MPFWSILTLSVGLAMDAMAVSAARGLAVSKLRVRYALIVALFFGGFQAGMPLLGWLLGAGIGPFIARWDHFVAFALLGGIGAKMLWEARKAPEKDAVRQGDGELFGMKVMLVLAVATSIDAFAVGITLPLLNAPLVLSLATIGVTTAVLSAAGLVAGRHFGALLGRGLDIFGGVVLILLGFKILIEHLLEA